MYSRIICAIGLGPREKAEHMLRRAAELIDSNGQITVVHVVETVPHYIAQAIPSSAELRWVKDVEDKLNALCTSLGIKPLLVVKAGRVAPTILNEAGDQQADLIIVGAHIQDITDAFFGSVVDRIARAAKCSVLVDRF